MSIKVRCLIAGIMVDKGVWLGMEYGLLGGVLVMEMGCSKGGGGCHGKWSLTAFDKKAGDHGLHGFWTGSAAAGVGMVHWSPAGAAPVGGAMMWVGLSRRFW